MEKVLTHQLQVYHIPAIDQRADAWTKPLSPSLFNFDIALTNLGPIFKKLTNYYIELNINVPPGRENCIYYF